MADVTERLIFDDSQAIPVLKNVSENLQKTSKDMQNLLDLMGKDAAKASAEMVKSEAKVNEAVIKTTVSINESKKGLLDKIKSYQIFGISIDGVLGKLQGFYDKLVLVKTGLGESTQATDSQQKGVEKLSNIFGGGSKAMTVFVRGLNVLKLAIISTGIGALIVILGSLIAYLTQTSEGSDKVSRIFQGLGAVTRVLIDNFAKLGKAIFEAFENPKKAISDLFDFIGDNILNRGKAIIDFFQGVGTVIKTAFTRDIEEGKQGLKDIGTALVQFTTGFDKSQQSKVGGFFKNLKDEANKAFEDGKKLFDRQESLYQRETDLILRVASLRRQISDLRFVSKDENESYSARIKSAEKALILERELINAEVETARARLSVVREENKLKGLSLSKEDKRTESQAVAAVQDAVSNASKLLRELNKTHQNLIQEAKKEFTSAVENLVEIRDQLIGTAKEFNLISDSKEQTYELQKQLDILNEQRNSIIAISTFFEVATGQNPFTKELELMDKLIIRVNESIKRTKESAKPEKIEQGDFLIDERILKVQQLQEEIEKLKTISESEFSTIDIKVNAELEAENIQKEIDKLLDDYKNNRVQSETTLKETLNVEFDLKLIAPTQGDPLDKSFGETLDYILNDINDFINGLDDAEDLLNKALKGLFGNGAEEARAFIGGLNEVYQTYSQIFQESSQLQIDANNEIIKQKEEQISKLEGELDKELELQELGLANNVGTKKEELTQLLVEQEKFEKENEELKKKAQKNQLIQDTLAQSSSIITSSINIIKGFSNIPIVGLPLGIAAVGALLTFFAATKAKAFAATKLEKGARRIDDHFGFVDRFGDSDKGAGQGYKIINARTGNDTNVRISGKEMLIPEAPSLIHTDFLYNLSKGVYNNVPLKEIAEHYSYLGSTENQKIINNEIINHSHKVINNTYNQKTETSVKKQWVQFEDKNGKGAILLEVPDDKAVGSRVYFN